MTTPKEFRDRHNLSEASFKRLTAKVRQTHPDLYPFTEKVQGREYRLRHEAILEAHLETYRETMPVAVAETPTVEAEVMCDSPLAGKIATLSTRFTDKGKHSAMSALAKVENITPTYVLPRASTIEARNGQLAQRQADIDSLDGVIGTLFDEFKSRNDIERAQKAEDERKRRAQELQAAMLDEMKRIYEEKQAREFVRQAIANGEDITEVLGANIDAITEAMQ